MGGTKCCVPGCRTNYNPAEGYITVFKFPVDKERREDWVRRIHRKDFTPTNYSVICIKHFKPEFIILNIEAKSKEGVTLSCPRKKPILSTNAYPTIFPNQPKYLSSSKTSRPAPTDRCAIQTLSNIENDKIFSLENFSIKLKNGLLKPPWNLNTNPDVINIYKCNFDIIPKIYICLNIKSDFSLEIWQNNNELNVAKFSFILGENNICDTWSKFNRLIDYVSTIKDTGSCVEDKLSLALKLLDECSNESLHDSKHFKFLVEQIYLFQSKHPHYSPETLLWSCLFFYTSPQAYKLVRGTNLLTIPHPSYIKKLSFNSDILNSGMQQSHRNYLQKKINTLNNNEMLVNLLIDEIHIKPSLSYKSGTFFGGCENSSSPATSLQAFMITSLMSSNKDIVALYPVKNLTGESLCNLLKTVLCELDKLKYKVISVISDNNRVNRRAFEILCDGTLKSSISHPYTSNLELFFLFDSVHIFKCIRNNWLNCKTPVQTFIFPPFDKGSSRDIHRAPLQAVKDIYELEKSLIVKYAPGLSQKVLYPSSFERQNVQYVINLFNEKTVSALKIMNNNNDDSVCVFIDLIVK